MLANAFAIFSRRSFMFHLNITTPSTERHLNPSAFFASCVWLVSLVFGQPCSIICLYKSSAFWANLVINCKFIIPKSINNGWSTFVVCHHSPHQILEIIIKNNPMPANPSPPKTRSIQMCSKFIRIPPPTITTRTKVLLPIIPTAEA